jgi:hypothetical protein
MTNPAEGHCRQSSKAPEKFRTAEPLEHSQFRHIEVRDINENVRINNIIRQRKRQRSPYNGSVLEPAATERTRFGKAFANYHDGYHGTPYDCVHSRDLQDFKLVAAAPSSPAPNTYERKQRRKTRADKYEPEPAEGRKELLERKPATSRKRPRTGKASANLLHNFSANNVTSDRLTVSTVVDLVN